MKTIKMKVSSLRELKILYLFSGQFSHNYIDTATIVAQQENEDAEEEYVVHNYMDTATIVSEHEEEDAEEEYVVSSLVEWRVNNKGGKEVLVQWGGKWSHSHTWQPVGDVEHLKEDLLELFKKLAAEWSLKDSKKGKKKRK